MKKIEKGIINDGKTVVFVHGAFLDGSAFHKVIPILQRSGLKTISIQNPLTSLEDDVEIVNRVLSEIKGKVILVGHSWGGMVITEAGNNKNVEKLVYISAYVPDEKEHLQDILNEAHIVKKIPGVPGLDNLIVDDKGFLSLSEEDILTYFAPDIEETDAKSLAATQTRIHIDALSQIAVQTAWKDKPSYFVVSTDDQMVAPQLLRNTAKKIGARIYELKTGHVPMLSQPKEVAKIILEASA